MSEGYKSFIRWIRTPILRFLALNDLVIIGDVYGSAKEPAVVQVPSGRTAEIIGSISVWDGPATVTPKGCLPKKPIAAVKPGNFNDPATWNALPTDAEVLWGASRTPVRVFAGIGSALIVNDQADQATTQEVGDIVEEATNQ